MPVIEELTRSESDGSISFSNHKLDKRSKLENFEHNGDLYKARTFYEIIKLERNSMFVYGSVPGTVAEHFKAADWGAEFLVESDKNAQITVQPEDDVEYAVTVGGVFVGGMKTNMSGKLDASMELNEGVLVQVRIVKREG